MPNNRELSCICWKWLNLIVGIVKRSKTKIPYFLVSKPRYTKFISKIILENPFWIIKFHLNWNNLPPKWILIIISEIGIFIICNINNYYHLSSFIIKPKTDKCLRANISSQIAAQYSGLCFVFAVRCSYIKCIHGRVSPCSVCSLLRLMMFVIKILIIRNFIFI